MEFQAHARPHARVCLTAIEDNAPHMKLHVALRKKEGQARASCSNWPSAYSCTKSAKANTVNILLTDDALSRIGHPACRGICMLH